MPDTQEDDLATKRSLAKDLLLGIFVFSILPVLFSLVTILKIPKGYIEAKREGHIYIEGGVLETSGCAQDLPWGGEDCIGETAVVHSRILSFEQYAGETIKELLVVGRLFLLTSLFGGLFGFYYHKGKAG